MKISESPITAYWLKYYVNKMMCSLCGNAGYLDTTGVCTASGMECGRKNYCICPNGQTLRVAASRKTNTKVSSAHLKG